MTKFFFRDRALLGLLLSALVIRLLATSEPMVERWYSTGFYPLISTVLRTLLGWVPISIGDLIYTAAAGWLLAKVWRFVKIVRHKQLKQALGWITLRKHLKIALSVYVVFQLFWGLNYSRQGIGPQLEMKVQPYTAENALQLTLALQQRLNSYAVTIDSVQRLSYNDDAVLLARSVDSYKSAEAQHSFLAYRQPSLKPSMFSRIGHWFGFTGYYNPFTAEAQIKISVPVFLKPFIATHEMAHQLGYAKENEASFVGYLACKNSVDVQFVYSGYFDMYREALAVCRHHFRKEAVDSLAKQIHPRVRQDLIDLREYLISVRNPIEPFVSGAYDRYLKLNNQPKGRGTYNEVVGHLVAYMKKFGPEAL